MPSKRIPLVGSLMNRTAVPLSYSTHDQRFENCFPEVTRNAVTGGGTVFLVKRLGFSAANNAGSGYVGLSGSVVWNGHSSGVRGAFAYLNSTTLAIYDTTSTIVGATISNITGAPRLAETKIGADSYLTLIATKSGTSRPGFWYLKEGDASWTEVDAGVDADYPANTPALTTVGNMVHMDGYAFIMDTKAQIWNSDLNSLTSWSTTSFITAQSSPDGGSGVNKSKNFILAFGRTSLDFFTNTGNATGSPLSRVVGASVGIGCLPAGYNNCETHKAIGDSVYFVGQYAGTGVWGVFRVTGTNVQRISTPAIAKELAHGAAMSQHRGIAGAMTMMGMQHVILYTGATYTPAYCIETNTWWYFRLGGDQAVETVIGFDGKSYLTVSTNSGGLTEGRKLWTSNPVIVNYYDYSSTVYTMLVQTQLLDYGTDKLKEFTGFTLIADTASTSATVLVSFSNNDYKTFSSTPKQIEMTQQQKRIGAGLGWGRRRSWKISDSRAESFRGEAFEVDWEVAEE